MLNLFLHNLPILTHWGLCILSSILKTSLSNALLTKARLGRVAPLGRPRSVYKSNLECHFVSHNGQIALKASHTSCKNLKMHIWCKFDDSSSNPLQEAEIPRILRQNGQNDLEGQGQWPPFSIPAKSIPWCMFGANLVIPAQICDELSCGQGKVYGQMDSQTDRRTDAGNDNIPSAWKAKG